jgi:putative transposase
VPWKESSPMSEKLAFIKACYDRKRRIADVCSEFGISEKTGYKHLQRFREGGFEALYERSHAPKNHRGRITPEVAERILAIRRKYPQYGPETIRHRLIQTEPGEHWPAASSIGELLKREGLIRSKRRRHSPAERSELDGQGSSRTRATEPNLVWTADFKGQFRLNKGAGEYCYPLTVLDLHTHFLLGCTALQSTAISSARKIFESHFREYGLPQVIRTDNGVPFAQPNALGRLGALAFWWVQLGIRPEHITLARPSENGAHERFHRTLKDAATKPSSESMRAQQKRFDQFRSEYNTKRPHRSLPDRKPPGHLYVPSARPYPNRLPELFYPDEADVRRVDVAGTIKWRSNAIFLSSNIAGQYVGITEAEGSSFSSFSSFTISYGSLALGEIDWETKRFTPRVRWCG